MCSYNKVNGTYACANKNILNNDLRDSLGFKGWVLTDWGGAHGTNLQEGLDQEMMYIYSEHDKEQQFFTHANLSKLNETLIDRSVTRYLEQLTKIGVLDENWNGSVDSNVTSQEHRDFAR